uniref:Uncharacterized protein n=1 Tax=Arundo donax TaxID=35708 RepID=A0A0A8Y7H1_ARUDO
MLQAPPDIWKFTREPTPTEVEPFKRPE